MLKRKSIVLIAGLAICLVIALFFALKIFPGSTGSDGVSIKLNNANNLGSLSFDLTYDASRLQCAEAKAAKLAEGAMFEANLKEIGRVRIALISSKGITGTGDLVTLVFKPIGEGGESQLELREVLANTAATLVDIRVEVTGGTYSSQNQTFKSPEIRLLN